MNNSNDIIEFVIRMKDMVSGETVKMAASAQTSLRRVDKDIDKTEENLKDLSRHWKINVDISGMERANREAMNLKRNLHDGMGGRAFSWGKAALVAGTTAAIYGAGRLGLSTLSQGANAEQDIVGLTTFIGEQKAKQLYAELQSDAAKTPFVTRSLLSTSRSLISAGVAPEAARKDAWNLANAVSAVGGGNDELSRMAINMQQIRAQGRAMGQDVKQFAMAGINIYQLLADATGKSLKEARNIVPTYDLLSFALAKAAGKGGIYQGALERQGQTIKGKWSTFMDYLQIGQQKLSLSEETNIKHIEDILIAGAKSIPEMVSRLEPIVDKVFHTAEDFIPDISALAHGAWDILKPIFNTLTSDEFIALGHSIVTLTTDLVSEFTPALDLATRMLKPFAAAINDTIGFLDNLLPSGQTTNLKQDKNGNWYFDEEGAKKPLQEKYGISQFFANMGAELITWSHRNDKRVEVTDQIYHNGHRALLGMANSLAKDSTQANNFGPLFTDFKNKTLVDDSKWLNHTNADGLAGTPQLHQRYSGQYAGALDEKTGGIMAGGQKKVEINFNRALIEHFDIHAKTMTEGVTDFKHKVEEVLLEVIHSVNTD